jgi:hypothetical protein
MLVLNLVSDEVLRLVQIANEYLYFVGCVIVPVSVKSNCGLSIVKGGSDRQRVLILN